VSDENVETVRRAVEALIRRDRETWIELCDPQIELLPSEEWPEGAIREPEACWDFLVASDEPWEPSPYEMTETVHEGDWVLTRLRRDMRGKSSGVTVAYDYWFAVEFRGRKFWRGQWFTDREAALAALSPED
jgi:ketosteroid isomerase-like protein